MKFFIGYFLFSLFSFTSICQTANKDQIEHIWYNEEKTAKIQIYQAKDDHYYGKIVWLKVREENGKPKVDKNNAKEARRNDPIMGLILLRGFKKDGSKNYDGGTIYDPKNGKTYDCKIAFKGDKLDIRGYVMMSLFGRTTVWTLAE